MITTRMICCLLCVIASILTANCSQTDNLEPSREAVREELRDPASAKFRNEAIRTLWTKGGQRLTIYCGEVNASNAFSGKTGFKPVMHVLGQRNLKPHLAPIWRAGTVYIYENGPSGDYYLNCMRSDTERNDEHFGKVGFGAFDATVQAEIDRAEPVLSKKDAPRE